MDNIQSAIDAGKQLAHKVHLSPITDGRPFIILTDGQGNQTISCLTETIQSPPRKIGTLKFFDAASFVANWKKHHDEASEIYAYINPATFTAVFDDHQAEYPRFRQHLAVFAPKYSREYLSWLAHNGREQSFAGTEDLALWIEDQLPDFIDPVGAAMYQMATNFRVMRNASFSSAIRAQDGSTNLSYMDEIVGSSDHETGSVKIPDQFRILIPVYEGLNQKHYVFEARFRYRMNSGKLTLWYELIRPHKIIEAAFVDIVNEISEKTERTVLFGEPKQSPWPHIEALLDGRDTILDTTADERIELAKNLLGDGV